MAACRPRGWAAGGFPSWAGCGSISTSCRGDVVRAEIDISLTTISRRVAALAPVIRSLCSQSLRPARIMLHLSREAHLLDQGLAQLPCDLAALCEAEGVVLRWVPNTGPYRKIIPWLEEYLGSERMVVTADDDTLYPADWLARLVAARAQTGAIAAWTAHPIALRRGRVAGYGQWFGAALPDGPALRILPIGKDGVLYAGSDFPPEVMDMAMATQLAPTADDLWLRWHLARLGRLAVAVGAGNALPEVMRGGASLWRTYNRQGGNDAVVAALEAHFETRYGWTMAQAV